MTISHQLSATPRLDGADSSLAEWVEGLADRIQAGERVDLSELTRVFPQRAEELRRLLPAIELMAELGRSATSAGAGASAGINAGPSIRHEPAMLGDFRLVREVGRGGMGVVFEAEQMTLRRRVALKILPFAAAMDARQLQRFQLEAQAAACLHHTNIVPVHAVGTERGVPYYAMQFIEGRTLAQVITELRQLEGLDRAEDPSPRHQDRQEEPADDTTTSAAVVGLVAEQRVRSGASSDPDTPTAEYVPEDPSPEAHPVAVGGSPPPSGTDRSSLHSSTRNRAYVRNVVSLGVQAAEALDHAHDRGILHRDIKPANLMLDTAGHLWVTDFGLAQIRGDSRLTPTGDILGTLRYMSPEQATARRVVIDGRTDVYSLGVTLYELLTLQPAIDGRDRAEILRRVVHEDPPSPRKLNTAVPRDLETIVQKAMAKEPESRYSTARELADDLRRFLEDRQIGARRPNLPERAVRWLRRHPTVAAATAVVLMLVTLGSAVSTLLITREQRKTAGALNETSMALVENRFFRDLFFQTSPFSPQGGTLNNKQILELAETMVAERFRDNPIVEARIRSQLGKNFRETGEFFDRAGPHLARALEIFRKHLGDEHPETLETRLSHAYILFKKDKAGGIREFREVLDIQRRVLGPGNPTVIETTWRIADVLLFVDRKMAVQLARETVGISESVRGTEDEFTLRLRQILVEQDPALNGDFDRKIRMLSALNLAQRRVLGPLHPTTLQTHMNLSWEQWAGGHLREALEEFKKTRLEHWQVLKGGEPLAYMCDVIPYLLLRYLGERRQAAEELESLRERWTREKGEGHDYVLGQRAMQALDSGDLETARRYLSDLWRRLDELPSPMCPLDTGKAYAESLAWGGDEARAIEVAEVVLADAVKRMNHGEYTENHYLVAVARDLMAAMLVSSPTSPEQNASRALKLAAANVDYFPDDGLFRTTLGLVQYRARLWDEAVATLIKADQLDEHRRFAPRGFFLAMAYGQKGEKEKALELFKHSAEWMDQNRPGHPEPARARSEAAGLLGLSTPEPSTSLPTHPFSS